jgi:hypothetical protein
MAEFIDYETDETPEQRRLRLLSEMGSPFLGRQSEAGLGTIDSGGAFGAMPQGFNPQPDTTSSLLGAPWMDPGQTPRTADAHWRGPGAWTDPGERPGGSGRDYADPPPRLGNLFSQPGEPAAPELNGVLFNGTRSEAGRGVLAQETPAADRLPPPTT